MTVLAKLAFLHRRNWERDPTYRLAFIAGPPPLLGAALAAMLWTGLHVGGASETPPPAWAQWKLWTDMQPNEPPVALAPSVPLPAREGSGWAGWPAGWHVEIRPVTLTNSGDVIISQTTLNDEILNGPELQLERITSAGPDNQPFIGAGLAMVVIQRSGDWELSFRTTRDADIPATCMLRAAFSRRKLVSTVAQSAPSRFTDTQGPFRFELTPGLYWISVGFGCWQNGRTVGSGDVDIMLRGPGDAAATPAASDQIVRRIPG